MRVCNVCRKQLEREGNWWSLNFSSNASREYGSYYELCADHKNQIHELIELKIEEAKK
ncbi:hypothetical protein LCGC14_2689700 [marine sediment metagenome]|uniref:PARP-type domain-containing protein n=1 Tax=marine sediment metagenome TaxID=412755 RepID=A0A0F9A6E0_9ZZZZ